MPIRVSESEKIQTGGCSQVGEGSRVDSPRPIRFSLLREAIVLAVAIVLGCTRGKEETEKCQIRGVWSTYDGQCLDGFANGNGVGKSMGGKHYIGEWLNGLPHGNGTYTAENGDNFSGKFQQGIFSEGTGSGVHKEGGAVCHGRWEGNWKQSRPFGKGTLKCIGGDTFTGTFDDGESASGKMEYSDGRVYDGEWSSFQWSGKGVLRDSKGAQWDGKWEDGLFHRGRWEGSNGNSYTGEWEKGVISGYGVYEWPNGDRYEGDMKDGKINGKGTYWFHDGRIDRGVWADNVLVTKISSRNRRRNPEITVYTAFKSTMLCRYLCR